MATRSASPLARVHALWTLDGVGALEDGVIEAALRDGVAGVRENAVRLAEPRLRRAAPLASRLVAMADDADARVRFMVLGALGSLTTPEAGAARRRLLLANLDDQWMQRAALSAGSDQAPPLFDAIVADGAAALGTASEARAGFVRRLTSIVGARQKPAEVTRVLDAVTADRRSDAAWWRAAALHGLADGGQGRRSARGLLQGSRGGLLALYADPSADVRDGALGLLRLAGPGDDPAWRSAVQRAQDTAASGPDAPRRADAIALVALDRPERRAGWFARFVSPHEPDAVQVAAVVALGRIDPKALAAAPNPAASPGEPPLASSADIGRFLLSRWAGFTPEIRSHAGDVLIADPARATLLVDALTAGTVPPWSLGFWQKQDLVLHDDPAIRAAARAVLEEDPAKRADTVRRYAAALDLGGEPARGAAVFARVCAACHRLGETTGGDLGPDLATVRHRPPVGLLADILLPSRSIAQKYETYVVERRDGGSAAGLLGAESPTTITLRQGGDRTVVVPRADIKTMTVSPVSTMPADLDRAISPDEMADLLAFIRRP